MKKHLSDLFLYGFILIASWTLPEPARAQKINLNKLEQQTRLAIEKAYSASVRIWGFDTVRKVQNSSQFSGVVVDKDGTILTVAHAIQPHKTYKVRFPDGREVVAVALGRMGFAEMQNRPDLGMMKLLEKGDWPVAEMGWSYSLKMNQPCISISYPETLNQMLPTVRFGKINKVVNEWGFVESSCKMEPGDSGGPLLDLSGRVVGLHSRCGTSEKDNFEVPVDTYRKYWSALNVAEDYKAFPQETEEIGQDTTSKQEADIFLSSELSSAFSSKGMYKRVVMLKSSLDGDVHQACATVFEDEGRTLLVSKSSIVKDDVILADHDKRVELKVLARDQQNDLVLLLAPVKIGNPIPLKSLSDRVPISKADLGRFLISPVDKDLRVSVLSSTAIDLPKKFSAGYIGAAAVFKDGGAVITRMVPNSPVVEAGMQLGDKVTYINDMMVSSADVYNSQMQKTNPGDTVLIQLVRNDAPKTVKLITTQQPTSAHAANQFEGGKSVRLDDFFGVFAHDAIVKSNECGGPVFDADGNFYGINIARFSRTSTIVMPTAQILTFIEEFIKNRSI